MANEIPLQPVENLNTNVIHGDCGLLLSTVPAQTVIEDSRPVCWPAGNGSDAVPASAANAVSSTAPFSALASFSHAVLSGKKACVMQNVRPS